MNGIFEYLSPIKRLGKGKYSYLFPLFLTTSFVILSEIFANVIVKNPQVVNIYGIFIFLSTIVYFAFRDGIRGGLIATIITIFYYAYFIITRPASPQQTIAEWDSLFILAFLYVFLAILIGWLKQTIDRLIERESNQRRRLQAIVEQLPVGILITDEYGNIELGNKEIEAILGRKMRKNVAVGRDTISNAKKNGKHVKASQWPLAKTLATGETVTGEEITVYHKDGKKLYLQISASLVHNHQGKVIAAASIINDITNQKEMEIRKDDFINMASHELKTPLTSITVFAQVLQKKLAEKRDKELETLVGKVNAQLSKLTVLVSGLLDVTRIQKGKLPIEKETFYVRELAEEVMNDLQPITPHKIMLDWHTKLPVFADKERMRQVLTNLVTNAMKYSSPQSRIVLGSHNHGNFIEVYVQDFGIGIPASQQKKIFDRFYQVSEHSTYPGLGLGLYISHEIVKAHGGNMWVKSKERKGSTFYFSLPVHKEQSEVGSRESSQQIPSSEK